MTMTEQQLRDDYLKYNPITENGESGSQLSWRNQEKEIGWFLSKRKEEMEEILKELKNLKRNYLELDAGIVSTVNDQRAQQNGLLGLIISLIKSRIN